MTTDYLPIKRKLDEATTALAPGGVRPPPYDTHPIEFTYGEMMMIWNAVSLCEAIRDVAKPVGS